MTLPFARSAIRSSVSTSYIRTSNLASRLTLGELKENNNGNIMSDTMGRSGLVERRRSLPRSRPTDDERMKGHQVLLKNRNDLLMVLMAKRLDDFILRGDPVEEEQVAQTHHELKAELESVINPTEHSLVYSKRIRKEIEDIVDRRMAEKKEEAENKAQRRLRLQLRTAGVRFGSIM
jgi:hypothetical protein